LKLNTYEGDQCSFEITRPFSADSNDVVFITIKYLNGVNATVMRGQDIRRIDQHWNVAQG
jgi:hypothetical protein